MRRNRILAGVVLLLALGVAVGTTALVTPVAGQILVFVLLNAQAEDNSDSDADSESTYATQVSIVNLSNQTCSYTVHFLDKWGNEECELLDTLDPGKQGNFSTNPVAESVYLSNNNCSPQLEEYKGHVQVDIQNASQCLKFSVVSGRVAWYVPLANTCSAGMCTADDESCTTDADCDLKAETTAASEMERVRRDQTTSLPLQGSS